MQLIDHILKIGVTVHALENSYIRTPEKFQGKIKFFADYNFRYTVENFMKMSGMSFEELSEAYDDSSSLQDFENKIEFVSSSLTTIKLLRDEQVTFSERCIIYDKNNNLHKFLDNEVHLSLPDIKMPNTPKQP